jgi:hypothetical protein
MGMTIMDSSIDHKTTIIMSLNWKMLAMFSHLPVLEHLYLEMALYISSLILTTVPRDVFLMKMKKLRLKDIN